MTDLRFTNPNVSIFELGSAYRTVKLFKYKPKDDQVIEEYAHSSGVGLSSPAGQFDYEFLIKGKKVPSALNQILDIFLEHYANLLTLNNNNSSNDGRVFRLAVSCNLEHSDIGPLGFCSLIRNLGFVSGVEYSELKGRLFGKGRFPLNFYGRNRAIALRSDTLIKLGMRLAREAGSSATSSLYEEGRAYAKNTLDELKEIIIPPDYAEGRDSSYPDYVTVDDEEEYNDSRIFAYCVKCREMKAIEKITEVILRNGKEALQGSCPSCSSKVFKLGSARKPGRVLSSPLIENMQGFLLASGLGTFELRSEAEKRKASVTILNPPTNGKDQGGDYDDDDIVFGNQFLEGIAAGFLESILGINNEMKLIGEKYNQSKKMLELHFAQYRPVIESKHVHPTKSLISATLDMIKKKRKKKKVPLPQIEEITSEPSAQEYMEVERIIHSLEQIEAQAREVISEKQANYHQKNKEQEKKPEMPEQILVEEKATTTTTTGSA
jgi:hypothetical protein